MFAYYVGSVVGLDIPVYADLGTRPRADMLKGFSAAGASSGGIEMYHVVGVTPEARTLEEATGGGKPARTIHYGRSERRSVYERLNACRTDEVDVVAIGCPHYSMRQVAQVATLLGGRKVHDNVMFLVYTAKQIETVGRRNGYVDAIEAAGGHVLVDSCPLNIYLPKQRVIATDAAKIAHYYPGLKGYRNIWYGSVGECVEAAVTGRWKGELQ
jgi:hypothetical protein